MTSWGRSFYNNILATIPVLIMSFIAGENDKLVDEKEAFTNLTYIMVGLSCVMGLGISISGFACRELISATSFSVVGNMNKVLTVVINFIAWDSHTSMSGLACLSICIVGGALYAKVRQDEENERKRSATLPQ